MKKLLLILFIFPLFSVFSYETNESIIESINVSSTNEEFDFRGVWKDDMGNYRMIWIDENGKYQYQYMDGYRDVVKTLKVELIGNKLLVETVFLKTNWKVTMILSLVNEKTINVEGKNENGSYYQTLIRINK